MPCLSAHSLTNASYSGSRSRFILIAISHYAADQIGGHGLLRFQSMPHRKALAVGINLGFASALPYVHKRTHTQRSLKRKDFPDDGPVRASVPLPRTVPLTVRQAHSSFIGWRRRSGMDQNQHSEWRVQSMPKGLTHGSPSCRKVVFPAGPMLPR
jgi:hypothetical protein